MIWLCDEAEQALPLGLVGKRLEPANASADLFLNALDVVDIALSREACQ
jgi:hypothetical protein